MLKNTIVEEKNGFRIRSLRQDDFFIHLCAHLYKEASTLPWVEMMRDMTLYKYCDIYMLLNDVSKERLDFLFDRAKVLGMEKICSFAVDQMSKLFKFKNTYAVSTANAFLKNDPDFVHLIASPKDGREYIFTEKDISVRFFEDSRKMLLQEVKNE